MVRRAGTSFALLAVLGGVMALAAGCGGSVAMEEKIIQNFFRASRIRDYATLGTFAIATFDVRKDGQVQSFKVVTIGEEVSHAFPLREYASAIDKAKAEEEAFTKEKVVYQRENIEAIQRVLKAEGASQPVKGRDAAVQTAWSKWREDTAKHAKQVSDARTKFNALKGLAELSLSQPSGATPDVTKMDGTLVEKDITIDAVIRTPDGTEVKKQLVVTLERTIMREGDGQPQTGRWIVTHVREPGQSKT